MRCEINIIVHQLKNNWFSINRKESVIIKLFCYITASTGFNWYLGNTKAPNPLIKTSVK